MWKVLRKTFVNLLRHFFFIRKNVFANENVKRKKQMYIFSKYILVHNKIINYRQLIAGDQFLMSLSLPRHWINYG